MSRTIVVTGASRGLGVRRLPPLPKSCEVVDSLRGIMIS